MKMAVTAQLATTPLAPETLWVPRWEAPLVSAFGPSELSTEVDGSLPVPLRNDGRREPG